MQKIALPAVVFLLASQAFAAAPFPRTPDPHLTPGSLCHSSRTVRYEERIPYCERNVDVETKQNVIAVYDSELGYRVGGMKREEFKIDHYIPLCMGGSNESDNLWPQHLSVYSHTDPVEQAACDKLSQGRIRQVEAVEIIKRAKANPERADSLLQMIDRR